VTATLSILEAARREDARVVVASSVAIYGDPVDVPIHEEDAKAPTSPYGVDKLAIDHYVRLYNDLYGLETVALRYFNVYGPRQSAGEYSGVVSTFLEQARSGQPITVEGEGDQTRDFVHVSDVVRANLAAAATDNVGRAYNVGTGDSITILGLAELIRDVTGSASGWSTWTPAGRHRTQRGGRRPGAAPTRLRVPGRARGRTQGTRRGDGPGTVTARR